MSADTKIEWCDSTFNPWIGCTKISRAVTGGGGCDGCYAEMSTPARILRSKGSETWGPGAPRVRTKTWGDPVRWNAQHEAFYAVHGRRRRVFCASLADVFDNEVPTAWRMDLFKLIADTPNLDWLILTKRIGNVMSMCSGDSLMFDMICERVWLGATMVNQEEVDRDIIKLVAVPAAKLFLSMEPLLSPVSLPKFCGCGCGKLLGEARQETLDDPGYLNPEQAVATIKVTLGIDWVIVGGESGPNARPMHPDWARSLRDQCVAAGVPFLFKQWGEHSLDYDRDRDDPDYQRCAAVEREHPGRWINLAGGHGFNGQRVHYAAKVGKKAAGRLLDGRTWDEFPT